MHSSTVRPAAVAGLFYPSAIDELRRSVDGMLAKASRDTHGLPPPKAMVAPHAGYIYSGPIAAHCYSLLLAAAGRIERVVLFGPTHRVAVNGIALPDADCFDTPLGRVNVDMEACAQLKSMPQVLVYDPAHTWEHSLEVHLPFLQRTLGSFNLVPLAVGHVDPDHVAAVMEALWGGKETLVVVSSDLSHFHPYHEAQVMDSASVAALVSLGGPLNHEQACGATAINALLKVARHRSMRPRLLDLRNSGDTAGDRARVVGYCSVGFWED
ncbi:MAG: AmmeMemoRadiSam system protein B [Rhodocyclaceae bacterium]|nr:AmmeMemoRadiSam system protein B [Rhodocyclaceae bacterium]MBX3667160.1 AmmeMemoRadiSam system protein B [Rhodocyclaceae bacterium]